MSIVSSAAIINKAGKNVDVAVSGALLMEITSGAIALVNNIARINYSDTFAALNDDVKWTLQEIGANAGAIYCISYNMDAYTTRIEAEDMINILRDGVLRGISLIRDKKTTTFIDGA